VVLALTAVSFFLLLSALTAIRPTRRSLLGVFAFPIGWPAGELAGQAALFELFLIVVANWWGWPRHRWITVVFLLVAVSVIALNIALVAISFHARTVAARAASESPIELDIPEPRDDRFGTWWRTLLQLSFHPLSMELHRNVPYGTHHQQRLDIWKRPEVSGAPVIVYVHGGAWVFGDKREQGRPMLHEFVARDWVVVSVNYRLAPQSRWPAPMQDISSAMSWIRRNIALYGGDPDRIIIAGALAGGQIAALHALTADRAPWRDPLDDTDVSVMAALSFYGVLEMTGDPEVWESYSTKLRDLLARQVLPMSVDESDTSTLLSEASPYDRISESAPPFLVIQGTNDTLVHVSVARRFVERFREQAFAPMVYCELPFTQHAYDVTASARTSATTRLAVAFASVVVPDGPLSEELAAAYQIPPTVLDVGGDGLWTAAQQWVAMHGPIVVVTSANPFRAPASAKTPTRPATKACSPNCEREA
jgi:acetyl esterase/lipase